MAVQHDCSNSFVSPLRRKWGYCDDMLTERRQKTLVLSIGITENNYQGRGADEVNTAHVLYFTYAIIEENTAFEYKKRCFPVSIIVNKT
ncbi:unnamed protein product [Arctia plantaginis]|uniref:Uncharacterized protein n=1 Tax=Arctia plantaginis TaxID=874455 RepID=A0A8S1BEJ8_ARCPL|nr:unnamed protein product [Arctia plantaginis]